MTDAAGAVLAHLREWRPVDASFMGFDAEDGRWPATDAGAERRALLALRDRLDDEAEAATPATRIDQRLAAAEIAHGLGAPPRQHNPAWATGEAAFGLISLLLPQNEPLNRRGFAERLASLPDFLGAARAGLPDATPASWTARAVAEAHALARFCEAGLPLHPATDPAWLPDAARAAAALRRHAAALALLPDAPVAVGEACCERLLREVHGLRFGVAAALADAKDAFAATEQEIAGLAARVAPGGGLADAVARATAAAPEPEDAPAAYAAAHAAALAQGAHLVTPATGYALAMRWMPACFAEVAETLYFLAYRSPPAERPGTGSVYWVPRPGADHAGYRRAQNHATIRSTHAIHHGSIGHHTQNARARAAPSRLARIGGTDAALGLACLSAGTMVEGWACHAQELMLEIDGFGSPGDHLLQRLAERRNIASVLVDLRLHSGEWSEAEAVRFYIEEAGFPAARAPREVTRNGMFPTSRAMYWLGTREIRRLAKRFDGARRSFHDTLLGFGHVPVTLAGAEMERAGLLLCGRAA